MPAVYRSRTSSLAMVAVLVALTATTAGGATTGHGGTEVWARNPSPGHPYVHGLVGTEAYNWLMPRNFDWADVSISKH